MLARLVARVAPPLFLIGLILCCFRALVAMPAGLIVDADRPSIDTHLRGVAPTVGNDLTRQYLPRLIMHARELQTFGRLPAWDDTGFGGRPLIGNPQAGLFYPPVWIAWWIGHPAGLGWLTLAHLVWAAIGVHVLGRASGLSIYASILAAGCVTTCPYVLLQASEGHYPHLWTFAWYPWAFWAMLKIVVHNWRLGLLLAPILTLAYLAGHAQEWFYLIIAIAAWGLIEVFRSIKRGDKHVALITILALLAIIGLALSMAAIEIVPVMLCQPWTLKGAAHTISEAGAYHITALNMLQWLDPRALGGSADYLGDHNAWETQLGVGLPVVLLGIMATLWSRDCPRVKAWLALLVVTTWIAAGLRFGLFAAAYYFLPGMDRFRVPARVLFLANLAAGLLAGFGFDAVLRGRAKPRSQINLAIIWSFCALAIGLILITTITLPISQKSKLLQALMNVAHDRMAWFMLFGTSLLATRSHRRVLVLLGFPLLILADRVDFAWRTIQISPIERFLDSDPISLALPNEPGNSFRIRADDSIFDDAHAFQAGLIKTNCYDAFQLQHAADLYETLYPMFENRPFLDKVGPMSEAIATYRRRVRQAVLDRMAVAYIIATKSDNSWPMLASGRWKRQTYAVMSNATCLPRAYVVPCASPLPEQPQAVLSAMCQMNPRETVLMRTDPLETVTSERQPFTPATWSSMDPDHVIIHVQTYFPGLLVIADTWMPGWTATVNGRPAYVHRGNHSQRIVAIPTSGFHEIQLKYTPPGLQLGTILSGLSLLVWIMLYVAAQLRSRGSLGSAMPFA